MNCLTLCLCFSFTRITKNEKLPLGAVYSGCRKVCECAAKHSYSRILLFFLLSFFRIQTAFQNRKILSFFDSSTFILLSQNNQIDSQWIRIILLFFIFPCKTKWKKNEKKMKYFLFYLREKTSFIVNAHSKLIYHVEGWYFVL